MSGNEPQKPTKIVIPKIVLKMSQPQGEKSELASFHSLKTQEFTSLSEHSNNVPSVSFSTLLKKLNQNTFRAIENVLEL